MHAYIHTYTHTYTRTYIHPYIHTYTQGVIIILIMLSSAFFGTAFFYEFWLQYGHMKRKFVQFNGRADFVLLQSATMSAILIQVYI
jgi:hypothetical protein